MKHINLLPWRQRAREEQAKLFSSWMIVSALLGGGLGMIIYLYAYHLVSDIDLALSTMRGEIQIYDRKIIQIAKYKELKTALVDRMKVVQQLQSTRALTVHLFDELTRIVPEGIYLKEVHRVGNIVTITGSSESNTSISVLMTNIAHNHWITKPDLNVIKQPEVTEKEQEEAEIKHAPSINDFELSFIVEPKPSEADHHGS